MAIFPLSQISSVITRVTFPIFSTIQDDNTRIRMGYLRAIKYTSLITFPLLTGLVVVAPELIPTLIGEKWIPMVSPLQILCIAGIIYSIATHTGSIILSKGRSDIHIRWDASKAVILPIAALIGVQYGIIGVATATALVACVLFLIIQKITNKLIDLRFYEFFKALYPATVSSTILVIGVLAFQQLCTILSFQDIFSLVGSILIGAVFYFLTVHIIDRNIFKEIKILLNQLT
jgi:O-antigen/teichoic acid export membrane protein